MSSPLSGSADPNLSRSAQPPAERYVYQGEQGGNSQRAELNIGAQSSIDQAISSGYALGGKPYGRDETKASSPTLEFPVWTLRTKSMEEESVETDWQQQRNDLTASIPKQLLADPAFADFLTVVAKAMGWLDTVSQPYAPNSPALNNIANGNQMVQDSILATLVQTESVLHQGDTFLKNVGAGHPEFDTVTRLLTDMKTVYNKTSSLTRRYEENILDDNDKSIIRALIQQLMLILAAMGSTSDTGVLKILRPTVNNMIFTLQLLLRQQGEQLSEITAALANAGATEETGALSGVQLHRLTNGFVQQFQQLLPNSGSTLDTDKLTIALGILLTGSAYVMQREPTTEEGGQP